MTTHWRFSLLVLLSLSLVACSKRSPVVPPAAPDYFEKRRQCAEQIERVKRDLERENRDASALFHSHQAPLYSSGMLQEVCYSKVRNTCVGFFKEYQHEWVKGQNQVTREQFFARDLLSMKILGASLNYYKVPGSAFPVGFDPNNYKKETAAIQMEVQCVE
jgi:hypothetical protein